MERATFRKHERLTGRVRIQELMAQGRTVHENPIKLVGRIMELPTTASAQVAFAVPKRYMKLAVDRNRMRRLMREAYRLNKGPFLARLAAQQQQCAWLFVHQSKEPLTLAEVSSKISRTLERWMEKHG